MYPAYESTTFESALQGGNISTRYVSRILWTLNPDIFLFGDVQDRAQFFTVNTVFNMATSFPGSLKEEARCKFLALYDACSVANIPRGLRRGLGTRVNPDMCRICSHRISSNFAIMEAIMAGTYSLKRFLQKTPGTEKRNNKWKT